MRGVKKKLRSRDKSRKNYRRREKTPRGGKRRGQENGRSTWVEEGDFRWDPGAIEWTESQNLPPGHDSDRGEM